MLPSSFLFARSRMLLLHCPTGGKSTHATNRALDSCHSRSLLQSRRRLRGSPPPPPRLLLMPFPSPTLPLRHSTGAKPSGTRYRALPLSQVPCPFLPAAIVLVSVASIRVRKAGLGCRVQAILQVWSGLAGTVTLARCLSKQSSWVLLHVYCLFLRATSALPSRLHVSMQNVSDLADVVGSGRETREEERALVEQLEAKTAAYQAAR